MCKCKKKKKKKPGPSKAELLERIHCLEEVVDGLVTSVTSLKRRNQIVQHGESTPVELVCNSI